MMKTIEPKTLEAGLTDAECWDAIVHRNSKADGIFLYAVQTTGIYCRPTCASRQPKRENVRFFNGWVEAEAAGFRPCKRCSPRSTAPQQQQATIIAHVCKQIERAETPLSLEAMAQMAGLSVYHFHRVFKAIVGVPPKQYTAAHCAQRLRQHLQETPTLTQAMSEAGFKTRPLDVQGTAFQQQVWQALQMIAPGTTMSYSDLAKRIGKPKAIRAVANACAQNQIAVAIPCHRVVGSDGNLRGYR